MEREKMLLTRPSIHESVFQKVWNDEEFSDVTLSSMDDKLVLVHRVILSSSSVFFRNLLARNKHQHPIIHLTGIKHKHLEMVLKLIYLGQCHIEQEDLQEFLSAGEKLGVNELIEDITIEKEPASTLNDVHSSAKDPDCIGLSKKENSQDYNYSSIGSS